MSPGVLLLRAMPTIRELDEVKLDPYRVIVGPWLTSTVSRNGDFQWHIALLHSGSIVASHTMWSKELPRDRLDSAAAYYFWVPTGRLALTFLPLTSYKF